MALPDPHGGLEAVDARHAHVDQGQARLDIADHRESLLARTRLPDRLEPRGCIDHVARSRAKHCLVVDGHDRYRHAWRLLSTPASGNGAYPCRAGARALRRPY